jgi:3'-phosphoadenosine 5'-phosphosulfate sulfotransferase (PAPS reductase)/FAD synthetase
LIDCSLREILGILTNYNHNHLQQAVIAKLTERVLDLASGDNIARIWESMSKKRVRHILGLSGGKDSTALAVLLHKEIPQMEYFFCDTHKELPETLRVSRSD